MGEHDVHDNVSNTGQRAFARALLEDLCALERIMASDRMERGVRRIGAEQEMFLVDDSLRPVLCALDLLQRAPDRRLTTELALFNLEANLDPQPFSGPCLSRLETDLGEVVDAARAAARELGADVLLAGILPTLKKEDLRLEQMTPCARYTELNRIISNLRGGEFHVLIKGLDELEIHHDNVMLEACNTSFQIHLQVDPESFARYYNAAQAISGPVLAAAVNSPLLFRRRLWSETRIALFQRSVDPRSRAHQARGQPPRVHFGDSWVRESVLEIFREDVARHRVLLPGTAGEDPWKVLAEGGVPELQALRLYNGTVYRWNRPCYGVADGVAHLRIESRMLPAGPSVVDEVANAALFLGLMAAFPFEHPDIHLEMGFDDAKANFFHAARHGLHAHLTWLGGRVYRARDLLLDELLPLARSGLARAEIDEGDARRYLDVLEQRVRKERTGAGWQLVSLAGMEGQGTPEMCHREIAAAMLANQRSGRPVHDWESARIGDVEDWGLCFLTVGQIMSTDLFTVRPADIVDMAAAVMDWRHVRHVPVEDDEGRLVGLMSHRALLRLLARGRRDEEPVTVGSLMHESPVTVTPETSTLEAIELMRVHRIGSLPVVEGDRLVGIVTERDLITVSAGLLERYLRSHQKGGGGRHADGGE